MDLFWPPYAPIGADAFMLELDTPTFIPPPLPPDMPPVDGSSASSMATRHFSLSARRVRNTGGRRRGH